MSFPWDLADVMAMCSSEPEFLVCTRKRKYVSYWLLIRCLTASWETGPQHSWLLLVKGKTKSITMIVPPVLIADHGIIWYRISLWSVCVSCSVSPPSFPSTPRLLAGNSRAGWETTTHACFLQGLSSNVLCGSCSSTSWDMHLTSWETIKHQLKLLNRQATV